MSGIGIGFYMGFGFGDEPAKAPKPTKAERRAKAKEEKSTSQRAWGNYYCPPPTAAEIAESRARWNNTVTPSSSCDSNKSSVLTSPVPPAPKTEAPKQTPPPAPVEEKGSKQ